MIASKGRYSKYIRPLSFLIDIFVITILSHFYLNSELISIGYLMIYEVIFWIVIAYFVNFYEVYRFTTPVEIASKLVKQIAVFLLAVISYFPFSNIEAFNSYGITKYIIGVFTIIILFKYLLFFYLKKYRIVTGNNYRNVIIVGYTQHALDLKELFNKREDYGYRFKGFFSDRKVGSGVVGKIDEIKEFSLKNNIDEIYCSLNELKSDKLKELIKFADEENKTIKFIPDTKQIFSKNLRVDYYEVFPVLSLQKTLLHTPTTKTLKRLFDIVFSLIVIILVLSWLIPIIAVIIKLESKGSVFFKQGRPGLNEKEFFCYKFRSMKVNKTTEKEASKNDPRVTKIGRFMRKTSIDELPQFFNVLKGDMSVVGPRPHLWSQNTVYSSKINKYMVRLYVKPGVTGLAQVRGYRGEIETDDDMARRIKFDVYYIENWSFLLDIKIIIQTVVNIFQGEEKAY